MGFSRRNKLALPLCFLALAATAASARPLSASSSSSSRRLLADSAPQFHSGAGADVFAQPMPAPFSFQQVATSDRAVRRAQRKGLVPPQQPATFVDAKNPPLEAAGDEEEQVTAQGGAPPQLPPGVSVPPGGQRNKGGDGNGNGAAPTTGALAAAAAAANGGKLPEGAAASAAGGAGGGGVQYMPNGAILKPLPPPRVVTFAETIKLPGVLVAIGLTGGALLMLLAGLGMIAHRSFVYRRADALIAAAVTPRATASMSGGGSGGGVLSRLGSTVRSSSVAGTGKGGGGSSGSEAGGAAGKTTTASLLQGRGSVSSGDDEAFTSPMAAVPKAPAATTSPW